MKLVPNHRWPSASTCKPAGEFVAQIAFQLTNVLNPRGFVLQSQGHAGVVFRRPARAQFYFGVGLVVVGLLAIVGGALTGLALAAVGVPLIWFRHPSTLSVDLSYDGATIKAQPHGPEEPGVLEAIERSV